MSTFLWVIVPYVCLAVFAVGHWWRYRYDKFGWTTRSSQLYERKLLRWASPRKMTTAKTRYMNLSIFVVAEKTGPVVRRR